MKHLVLGLLTLSFSLSASAWFGDVRRTPEEIIAACSKKMDSIQQMESDYAVYNKVKDNSSVFTKALSTTGVSSIATGGFFWLVQSSDIALLGPISVATGLATVVTASNLGAPDYEVSNMKILIAFPNKQDAQSFVTERAYRVNGLQSEKFKAQCKQQIMNVGQAEQDADRVCETKLEAVSYMMEKEQICPAQ